jgi:hypothetical protein
VLEFSRALARQFRAVLRRSLMEADPRGPWPVIVCRADRRGLSLEAQHGDLAVRYRRESAFTPEVLNFPGGLLAEMEGRGEVPVALEAVAGGKGHAHWSDGAVPRAVEFDMASPDKLPMLPEMPKDARDVSADLLVALGEAARSAAREAVRFAVNCVQLRGREGQVVATDGRQLLVQGGFAFPWAENVLVPRLPIFGHRDLPLAEPVRLGRSKDVVLLETGPWTFLLRIDKDKRFPQIEQVIPAASAVTSRLRLEPVDLHFLVTTLPRLPGAEDDQAPITLELCQPPLVRARVADEGPSTEVVLTRSTVSGQEMRLHLDRQQLLRGLKLGFSEIQVVTAETPAMLRDALRVFVFVPLDPKSALPSSENVLRISSVEGEVPPPPHSPERTPPIMPVPQSHGNGAENNGRSDTPAHGNVELIAETEALRDLLHEATGRTARLIAALKLQKRQTRAVQQAMHSLRSLQLDR